MSIPPRNPLPGNGMPLGQFLNRINHPTLTPNDIGMAEDPVAAGVEAVLGMARPHEGLAELGPIPPTVTDPSQNARSHGLTAERRNPYEESRYQVIRTAHHNSLNPEIPEEVGCVDRASHAMLMWEKCDAAIQSLAITCIDEHKTERRKPYESEVTRLEGSLRIWEHAQNHKFPFGQGLGTSYPILLKDVDPDSNVKDLNDTRAREFAYFHTIALASPRLMELFGRYSRQFPSDDKEPEYREYLELLRRLDEDKKPLFGWVSRHVMDLRARLDKAKRELARVDAMPVNKDVLLLKSDDFRKFRRYQKEAESSYYRNLKGFDTIRARLMTCYDRSMQRVQKEYAVMFKVGPLGVHLPDSLGMLCPYDQLESMIRIFQREQRYYDPGSRNAERETAARAKLYENEGITAATWNGVDSADGINPRIIGGETSLRPAPGAPKPPDAPDSPR